MGEKFFVSSIPIGILANSVLPSWIGKFFSYEFSSYEFLILECVI
jgi:hypothetical protein